MQIKLISLSLKNFKGFRQFSFCPQGENVSVIGDNGTGKTSLFDAFLWLLFGKDSQGKSDFAVKPLTPDGTPLHNLDVEVEAILALDDKKLSLKKVMKEKWTKKRGSPKATFTGHTFEYYLDGVPVKKKEWDARLKELVDEEVFKLITNPFHFPSLPWEKRRQILLAVCGSVSPQQVIEQDDSLTPLLEILCKRSIQDHIKSLKSQQRTINKKLKEIPARIDELSKLLDVQKISTAEELTSRIDEIDKQIEEKEKISAGSKREEVEGKIWAKNINLQTIRSDIENIEATLERLREDHRKTLLALKDVSLTCPYCGQQLPPEKIDEVKREIKKTLDTIKKNGKRQKELKEKLEAQAVALQEEIKALREELNNLPQEEDLQQIISNLRTERATLMKSLSVLERIEELKKEEKKLVEEYEELEHQLYICEKYIVKQVEMTENQINSKFRLAKFKLFDQQINGGIVECCEIIYNGVPFDKGLNRGMQINIGLDIINTLSEHYGISAPIFIDNAEATNYLIPTKAQVIRLAVPPKKVETDVPKNRVGDFNIEKNNN